MIKIATVELIILCAAFFFLGVILREIIREIGGMLK